MGTPRDLGPLQEGLAPEAAQLANELRTLFGGLMISFREYVSQAPWDISTVSRYLSGERVPDWKFVEDLLSKDSIRNRNGAPPAETTVRRLKALHRSVLRASNSPHKQVIAYREELAKAKAQVERAKRREEELLAALQATKQRIAELVGAGPDLVDDPQALLVEVARIGEELQRTRELRWDAEFRAVELERQLVQAELNLDASEGHPASEPDIDADQMERGQRTAMRAGGDEHGASEVATNAQKIAAALASRDPKQIAQVLHQVPLRRAAEVLASLEPRKSAEVLKTVSTTLAGAVLSEMGPEQASELLDQLGPPLAAQLKTAMNKRRSAEQTRRELERFFGRLRQTGPEQAATELGRMNRGQAIAMLRRMHSPLIAELLDRLETEQAAEFLDGLEPNEAAMALLEMKRERISELLDHFGQRRAAKLLNRTDPRRAVEVLASLSEQQAAEVLSWLGQGDVSRELDRVDSERLAAMSRRMEEERTNAMLLHKALDQVVDLRAWLEPEQAADLLRRLEPPQAAELLAWLEPQQAAEALARLQSQHTADLLGRLEPNQAADLLKRMGLG